MINLKQDFNTSDEQEAFEAEANKPTTGDRKQDVLDIWFAARDFFEKPTGDETEVLGESSS